ncbi:hypothetical protein GOP47_0016092 [Adiantum capillus-veneris]|uniref:Presenilin n=1 Tax=Adiantum capillus-veneris TaxID=13818 RepID=A0A9D4ZEK5_ADICA|nr:hypothetical protein GOP47_0016092 [Adiantum capillus-veneris]
MEGGDGILESVGAELTGIVMPVSLCMLLVVMLVRCLTPNGSGDSAGRSMATLVYMEKASDTTSQKLEGAFLNSLVFVVFIAIITFLMVLLYYYRCTKCIKCYICYSVALMLGFFGGSVSWQLIRTLSIPIDLISFTILLFNFTVVGALAIFLSHGIPILVTQFYLVMIGVLAAYSFTMLPEWTTWMILVAMALYDLVAVLAPKGPLNLLVELAISRNEELPALIYETRPVVRPDHHGVLPFDVLEPMQGATSNNQGRAQRWRSHNNQRSSPGRENTGPSTELQPRGRVGNRHTTLGENMESERGISEGGCETAERSMSHDNGERDEESLPLISHESPPAIQVASRSGARGAQSEHSSIVELLGDEDAGGPGLSAGGGLKLGLGDFVFYSLLVGRAAMYDLTTVYACYLAIIAGLGVTLILLAVARRALPALPISIALGVIFYFLTRLLLEPLVAGLSTSLVIF